MHCFYDLSGFFPGTGNFVRINREYEILGFHCIKELHIGETKYCHILSFSANCHIIGKTVSGFCAINARVAVSLMLSPIEKFTRYIN